MNKFINTLNILNTNKKLASKSEVENFDKALSEVDIRSASVDELQNLYYVFDDATKNEEVMFGLLHLIEEAELDTGIMALFKAAGQMEIEAPRWLETILCRILNDNLAKIVLKKKIKATENSVITRILKSLSKDENGSLTNNAI